ncbi:MAG: hypothetical protein DRG33_00100 [Deltaproteobacteria bacterium]|nr:MAG: hypothetical protein DRG33_00100 [Deltaproteobacteria bacterium]
MEPSKNSSKMYYKEQSELLTSLLNHTFERGLKEGLMNFDKVEYYITTDCNLNCRYCYLRRYGDELYPRRLRKAEKIVENSKILTNWLKERDFAGKLEIFSGEPTILPYFFDILDYVLENLPKTKVVIPTNMTFLFDDDLTAQIEERLKTRRVFLSASIDGRYLQNLNRPFKCNRPYDDAFYDKAFAFAAKWGFGFHPMVYSSGIELWQKNFLWFMEMHEKYNLPKESLYLLEVRNEEWNERQIYELYKFMRFLVRYVWEEIAKRDSKAFFDFIFEKRGFNILSSPFSICGRGIGCSIQSTLTVRLGDLAIVPCHRLSYEPLIAGKFIVRKGRIVGVKARNPEVLVSILSATTRDFPVCESCILKYLCSSGCLGAQFEATGNMFAPIPTVCMVEHWKILGIILELKELGLLEDMMSRIAPEKRASIRLLLEVYEDARNRAIKRAAE